MSAQLWIDTDADETIDLGVDGFTLYQVFAEMDHLGGMKRYPQLFGVIEASELQEDVDPAWLAQVRQQASRFLSRYRKRLSPDAVTVLEALAPKDKGEKP
jgi:hypothetical protein